MCANRARRGRQRHLDKFSEQGLRTLVFAGRELSREEYEAWNSDYEKACLLSEGREETLRQARPSKLDAVP